MSTQFSASDIETLLGSEERQYSYEAEYCSFCGNTARSRRQSSKNGCRHCPGPNEWDEDYEPLGPVLTAKEREDLTAEIIAKKNATYRGGYLQWCEDRGIPKEKRLL